MLDFSAIFASAAVFGVGLLILWSNPVRWVNRTVFSCSIHFSLWLAALHLAMTSVDQGLFWLRCTTSIAALIPFHFWLVKEAIASDFEELRGRRIVHGLVWLLITGCLAFITFTDYFIPSISTPARRLHGPGYYVYMAGSLGLYFGLAVDSFSRIKLLSGGRRLALQVWLGGGCAAAATIIALMMFNAITHDSRYIRLQPIVVLVYYGGTAFAITTYRIFDARQLVLMAAGKVILVGAVAAVAYLLDTAIRHFLYEPFALVLTTGLALWFAATLNAWLDRMLQFYPQAMAARQAAFSVAQRERRVESLEKAFVSVLMGWGQSEHAVVASGTKELISGGTIELTGDCTVIRALRQLRWATPERLARERPTPERIELGGFLTENRLGVLVLAEGPALTALVGVGVAASRRPFTYPQVTQLMELASIMESALERAHFSAKVQHAEQLATVGLLGASLAHEIRNPLVTIKTFVQLLPKHYQDPVFRQKFFHLIGEEVGRIDQLTEQLLDLATPRTYEAKMIELHAVLRASLDLVVTKASAKNVRFMTDFQASPDSAFTDASAAKQVMLNLCFNAIQAVEARSSDDRWVKIGTRNTAVGIEMAVADSGLGIAPEIRPRLFQPFQTTKSTGFGLGLAICSDILANLNASISVDPPAPGAGATFRVTFPCQPLSS